MKTLKPTQRPFKRASKGRVLFLTGTAALSVCINAAAQIPAYIPDPNLEFEIRSAVQKPPGLLTTADVASLTDLALFSSEITNLAGLEWAVNLKTLNVCCSANLKEIEPLRGL